MENANNSQSGYESTIKAAIQNVVAGNSFVNDGEDGNRYGKLYNNAVFGLACTAYGIDVLLRYKGKKIPLEIIAKCTQQALQTVMSKYKQKTPIPNSSRKKLPEMISSMLERPTIGAISEIFAVVFGNDFSELMMFDALLDYKIFDFNLEPEAVDVLIEYINSKKNDYSNNDLEWFIDTIKYRKGYCKKNIDVMNKLINTAKAILNERSLQTA